MQAHSPILNSLKRVRWTVVHTADSISIGDEFIRYPNPNSDDEHEIAIYLSDDAYEFTTESIDKATFDDGCWSLYCDHNKQMVDVQFYRVTDITTTG